MREPDDTDLESGEEQVATTPVGEAGQTPDVRVQPEVEEAAGSEDDEEEAEEEKDAEPAEVETAADQKAEQKANQKKSKKDKKAEQKAEQKADKKSKKDKKAEQKADKKSRKDKKAEQKADKKSRKDKKTDKEKSQQSESEIPLGEDVKPDGGDKKLKTKEYEAELARLQVELVKLQAWVKDQGLKVVVLFEGRDAAGKGGVIKRITQHLNPRVCRVVALPTPTEREQSQWYFQRYVPHLPAAGEMVCFDRSWYNRAGVERVMGFCNDAEYQEFLRSCPEFERMLVRSGIILVKYWFSVSDDVQERRFQERMQTRTKRWKLSPMDLESRSRWVEYSRAKDIMFAHTDIKQAPWYVVEADVKKKARLNCIAHLLSMIPYQDLTPEPLELPPRQKNKGYVRPPMSDQTFVPEAY